MTWRSSRGDFVVLWDFVIFAFYMSSYDVDCGPQSLGGWLDYIGGTVHIQICHAVRDMHCVELFAHRTMKNPFTAI